MNEIPLTRFEQELISLIQQQIEEIVANFESIVTQAEQDENIDVSNLIRRTSAQINERSELRQNIIIEGLRRLDRENLSNS